MIFISHRSTDKDIADMLVDFFKSIGISNDCIFCSSLPGNDINERISYEVKEALEKSIVNIAILSKDYYQSAYCLNEAGIFWYRNVNVIPIALPEITPDNMYGFLNSEYKLRRLNSDTDISYIYDVVVEKLDVERIKAINFTREVQKLNEKYCDFLKERETLKSSGIIPMDSLFPEITTDDEKIVLYYILKNNVRKVSKNKIIEWMHEDEIYDINIDNAFDLLASFEGGSVNDNELEIGITTFRKYSSNSIEIISALEETVLKYVKKSVETFEKLWNSDSLDDNLKLFLSYIIDNKIYILGDRWKSKIEIDNIIEWEKKKGINSTLSDNYSVCLQFMIKNNLVYESSWTSYGNPREYTLCKSLREFLFNIPDRYIEKLQEIEFRYELL